MKKYRYFYSAFLLIFLFFCSSGATIGAIPVSSQIKLVADDAFKDAGFGWGVAIDGDTAVVSAFADYDNIGAAYVYERTGSGWQQVAKLTASDGEEGDFLGISVAVSDDTVVLGAALDDNAGGVDAGAVYVYVKPASGWVTMTETVKLTAPSGEADRGFGGAVSLRGDTLVIGAPGKDDALVSGEVFLYEGGGSTWSQTAVLSVAGLNGSDSFGTILDFDGNTIVVGAFGKDDMKGAVYVYHRPAGGWSDKSHDAMLAADDGAANDFFGGSVAVDGDTILVGANGDDDNGSKSGAIYLFERGGNTWVQQAKLMPADGAAADNFGYAVELASNTAVIGASHFSDDASDSIYIFTRSGGSWTEQGEIPDPDAKAGSKFGLSVAIDDAAASVLVGAFGADAGTERSDANAGAAYLFELESPVDLALVKQDDTDPVLVGGNVTYSLLVTNNSDNDATGVIVTDTLPAGLSYVSDDGGCSRSGQTVSCDLGTIGKNGGTGSVAITARADSTGSLTNTATVSANETDANSSDNTDSEVTVVRANTPPVAADDSVSTDEDTAVTTGNVLANDTDPDGDTLNISGADGRSAQGGTVVNNGDGTFTYTPPAGFDGSDSFSYTVSDGNGGEDQGSVQITVNAVNHPPVAADDSVSTDEDTAVTTGNVLANDTDPDGDTLNISGADVRSAQGGTVVNNGDGTFTYTPPAGFSGNDSFRYTVSDGNGGETRGTVQIAVNTVNHAPMAMADSVSTTEGSPVTTGNVLANDTDPDGDSLSISGADSQSAEGGSVVNNGDGTFTYTPPAGYSGTDGFSYTVSDGNGAEAQGRVNITVTKIVPVNNPPVAMDDSATTQQNTPVTTGDVLANDSDPDGDSVTVSGVDSQSAQGGAVVDNGDGTFTYTPANGYVGSDTFNYMISDGKGGQAQGTVIITVEQATATNTDPVAADDSAETEVDTAVTIADVLANDSDADGDPVIITGADTQSRQGGSVDNHGDGSFTYMPPAGFSGEDSFSYTISDGNGGEDQGTVTITVNKQDDGDGFGLGAFDLWMLLLLLFPLGYRRYQYLQGRRVNWQWRRNSVA